MAEAPATHDLRLMTSPETLAALPDIGCLLVPVGSCEQHGPNLALAADAAQAAAGSIAHGREMTERGTRILCEFLADFMDLPVPGDG